MTEQVQKPKFWGQFGVGGMAQPLNNMFRAFCRISCHGSGAKCWEIALGFMGVDSQTQATILDLLRTLRCPWAKTATCEFERSCSCGNCTN